jgi:hypothetical protein
VAYIIKRKKDKKKALHYYRIKHQFLKHGKAMVKITEMSKHPPFIKDFKQKYLKTSSIYI